MAAGMSVMCYPTGLAGCTGDATAGFTCAGTCAPGIRECLAGTLAACSGHTPSANEECTSGGTAADEDCDGMTDEGCSCTGNEQQACSSGGNPGVGECRAGTQTCNGNSFGSCENEVLPADETCANEGHDDDCNTVDDDVPMRGDACVDDGAKGVCRDGTLACSGGTLVCDTPAPAQAEKCDTLDDDCDGRTDEDFPLATDEANCGRCGNQCGLGKTCCAGSCVDTKTTAAHCGMCGSACGQGLTCCNSDCVDTDTNASHCGTCGRECGGLTPRCCGANCKTSLCL
jgi:hypothetical protein